MANEKSMSDSIQINGYYVIISNLEKMVFGDHAVVAGMRMDMKGSAVLGKCGKVGTRW